MFQGTYAALMAEYNRWMNEKIYAGAARLSDEERKRNRGALFKSIHGTLDHLIWGDGSWLGRFNGRNYPKRLVDRPIYPEFTSLRAARTRLDEEILEWAHGVTKEWLAEPMTWTSGMHGFTQTHPRWVQVAQMFNRQTHHRGQVHAMLTAAGIDIGPTDIPVLPLLQQR